MTYPYSSTQQNSCKNVLPFWQSSFKTINSALLLIVFLFSGVVNAQTYYNMSSGNYAEDFADIANATNWPNGFNGPSSTEWRGLAVNATGTIPDGVRLSTATNLVFVTASSGGVQRGTANIQLLSTGATDNTTSAAIELYLDFTGRTAGTFSADFETVFNSTGNRTGTVRVYYSTDGITYTELTGTGLPYLATNNVVGSGSASALSLPAAFDNAANARLRFYYHNGSGGTTGSRPKISIDNISVTSTAAGGPSFSFSPTSITGMVGTFGSPGTPATTTITGSLLTPLADAVTVNAPTNFEVSKDNVTYGASRTFDYTAGGTFNAANSTVYFRTTSAAPAGPVSGSATTCGGGMGSPPGIALSGTVTGPLVSASTAALPGKVFANHTHASQGRTFTVEGSFLGANPLTVGPLAGYEFSTVSNFATVSSSLSFTPVAGTVPTSDVYVRLTGITVGTFAGNIPVASTGAATVNVAITGQVYAAGVAFMPGNYVVAVSGETGTTLGSAATPVFLREYNNLGTLVQSILAPVSMQGANNPFTQSGTSTTEGYLNLSPDGKYLTLAGYSANPVVTTAVSSTNPTVTPRVVARVDFSGTFNTSTTITDGFNGQSIRSAVTIDGNSFWTAGAGGTGLTGGGVRYSNLAGNTSVQVSNGNNGNTRVVAVTNSQLYVSSGAGTVGILAVGTGFPTTTGQANALRATISGGNPTSYRFLDRDPIAPGNDVLYVANFLALGGIQKFSSTDDGATWTARGIFTSADIYRDISVEEVGLDVVITAITGAGNSNTIVRLTDNAAWNAPINISSGPTTIVASSGTDVFFKAISLAPILVSTPDIAFTQGNPVPATLSQGAVNRALYRIQVSVTTANSILTGVSLTTAGTYVPADFTNFKLRISNDATLDAGDATLATQATIPTSGGTLAFTGLAQGINNGQTRYLFITADISGCANVGNDISLTGSLAGTTFTSGAKTGTLGLGSVYNVVLGTLANPTGITAPTGSPSINISWINPTCSDEIAIFVSTSPISGTPPLVLPAGNSNFTLAPNVPSFGRIVFRGMGTNVNVTGVNVGTTYFVRLYNKVGSVYSSGVGFSYTPQFEGIFAVASGDQDQAIWALTPAGTPSLIAAVGGFNSNRNIIIQPGITANMLTSGITCRDLIVRSGATLRRSQADYLVAGNTASMIYFNVHGNIINDGTIGNGSLFNPIGVNFEATTTSMTGFGTTNFGRMRKNTGNTQQTTLTINTVKPVGITFPGAALYNPGANARLEIVVPGGRTLSITDPAGSVSFDNLDGTTGTNNSGGSLTLNGTLNLIGTFHLRNNNDGTGPLANQTTNLTINPTGQANIGTLIANLVSGVGSNITVLGRLNIATELNVLDGNLITNGQVTLLSTATNTARISPILPGASITGEVTLQRYVPNRGWHFIGHASTSGQLLANWNDNFNTYGPMPGTKFFNPGPKTSSIFAYDDFAPSVLSPEINGWYVPTTTNVEFRRGYRVHFGAAPVTFDNKGPVANGTVTTNLSYTPATSYIGWNLISNPHPAPINWDAVVLTNTNPALVTFNPAINKYQVYLTSGAYGPAGYPTANTVINAAGNILASSQAFMVRANGVGASVAFPQTAKASSAGTFYRSTSIVENTVRIKLSDSKTTDEAIVRFMDIASPAYELGFDADKISNPDFTIYTASMPDQKLAINSLGSIKGTEVVPIVIQSYQSGNFTLTFDELNSFASATSIYLKDNVLKTVTEVNETTSYAFALKANESNAASRFELIFAQQAGLSFSSDLFKSQVKLYPNPADAQSGVKLLLNGFANEIVTIEVSDLQGRVISSTVYNPTLSVETLVLNGVDKLSAGTYIVRTVTNNGAKVEKLVIR